MITLGQMVLKGVIWVHNAKISSYAKIRSITQAGKGLSKCMHFHENARKCTHFMEMHAYHAN